MLCSPLNRTCDSVKILYGGEFWKVDKLKSAVNDHWHCILSDTRVSGDSLTETARDEDIDLESGEYVPVGHIWKFDLEGHENT